jgi:hypothetical protein
MDAIHRSRVEPIFESLDAGIPIKAPVINDLNKRGFRIDLSAIDQFFPKKQVLSLPEHTPAQTEEVEVVEVKEEIHHHHEGKKVPVAPGSVRKVRAQFELGEDELEALKRLAEAEGFYSYTDWLRDVVRRVLAAPAGGEVQ